MWELIRQNKRKSFLLFIGMGCLLMLLGYIIGAAYAPPSGGIAGLSIAIMIWVILSLVSYFNGDSIALSVSGAKEITRDVHPQLFNVVEEMKIAAGLPAMPKIYIIDSPAPNAFATGRKPEKCAIAVTAGLLERLNRDELQGVIAHETSHIHNRDILFMTFAGIMLGSIVLISEVYFRGLMFRGVSSRRRSSSRSGGQAQAIIAIAAIVLAILAPIIAQLLYLAVSRRREYLADASAARLTRYPEGLASALEKISKSTADLPKANKVTAPMYIVNPLKKKGMKLSDLTSTHPPTSERIKILRAMSHGVSLRQYQEAYNRVEGKASNIIPPSALKDTTDTPIRAAAAKADRGSKPGRHGIDDLMRAADKYIFLTCACGLKMKIPPDFKKSSFTCPRCGRENKVPVAELAAMAAVADSLKTKGKIEAASGVGKSQATYHRKGSGWESFYCSCGNLLQLSPSFTGTQITCNKCGRQIGIHK